jgi:putative CocE/NonD family hydrolase
VIRGFFMELLKRFLIFVLIFPGVMSLTAEKREIESGDLISKFGKYEGYSKPIYDEWRRTSRYLEMSDGVKLALDIIRPAKNGNFAEEPLPVIWDYYAYVRAGVEDGKIASRVDRSSTLQTLVKHGYIVVVVDARGLGASFGMVRNPITLEEGKYGYEITEWIASQSWCSGNVGMFGHSYSAIMHFMIASQNPPHLKAIFPSMASFDFYHLVYPGGIFRKIHSEIRSASLRKQEGDPVAPVDEDSLGAMLAQAKEQHKNNLDPLSYIARLPYRNSEEKDLKPWTLNNPMTHVQAVSKSNIPVYQWAGWFDVYIRDAFQWFANLKNPQRLVIGPWAHGDYDSAKRAERYNLYAVEQLRWFDYWLKGIDNGIMDEPPIQYAIMQEPDAWTWHTAEKWPLPTAKKVKYYFSGGSSGSILSANDGILLTDLSDHHEGKDEYIVDYTTTVGDPTGPRGPNRGREDPDMTSNDAKGLTYTTLPLREDITIIGHPVATLFITSTAQDGNFYVYLEEVDKDGKSHYITDGVLRASHRLESEPPFNNLGLPFHRHFKDDVNPISKDEINRISFDLMPTANVFNKGHRIRVTITCANTGWDELLKATPSPAVTLYRNKKFASNIILPVLLYAER